MGNLCQAAVCNDFVQNGDETDVDCGGSCPDRCVAGQRCAIPGDCESGVCTANFCQTPRCDDSVQNGTETDVDCGGSCPTCGGGQTCSANTDCQSGVWLGGVFQGES